MRNTSNQARNVNASRSGEYRTADARHSTMRPLATEVATTISAQPLHDAWEYTTIGFRGYRIHADLIMRAAAKASAKAGHHISMASYMRGILIEYAASDLGEKVPEYASLERGKDDTDEIAEAAKRAGVSVKEYMTSAAKRMARAELHRDEELKESIQERFMRSIAER